MSGCDGCESKQENVETYVVRDMTTGEEKPMKLCLACRGDPGKLRIEIISGPLS